MKSLHKASLQLAAALVLLAGASHAGAAEFEAELDWAGLYIVNFPLDGGVTGVHVRPGDRVGKGDRLVELNAEPIEIRISQYEAELAAAKPVLADARRELEHAKSLYEQTVLSDVEVQRAQHAYDKAAAEMAASRARLEYARWQKRMATATAPFDARVIARNVERGQMLVAEQRSRALLVLASTGLMTARARLPLSSAQALETGQPVTVLVENKPHAATVTSLGIPADAADNDTGYLLEAEFQVGPEDGFRAGQGAMIRLP